MEEQNKESAPEVKEIIPPTPIPEKPKLSRAKILILGICAALVLVSFVGAYFLGKNNSNQQVACTQEAKICPDGSSVGRTGPQCEFSPCPTDQVGNPNLDPGEPKTTSAAVKTFTSAKLKDLSFSGYSLGYPSDWTLYEQRDEGTPISTITLTKNGYTLKIFQAATGGAGCIYTGAMPEGPASDYRNNKYKDLVAGFATLRQTESPSGGKMSYVYCQESSSDNSFGQPTSVGHMSATTGAANPDPQIISEIEEIVKSIKTL